MFIQHNEDAPFGIKLTPVPYEKAQTSEEKIYMQAVCSSRQLSKEVLCMSAWFLSSSTRGGPFGLIHDCERLLRQECHTITYCHTS